MELDKWIETIRNGGFLKEEELDILFDKLSEVLYQEPTLLQLPLPITICGDIHGQLYDLFELFKVSGGIENNQYLFLGDYVDRGFFSCETFCYLACLKLKYPNRLFLLRGNHECREVNNTYGFLLECVSRYGHAGVWRRFNEIFDLLPISAIVDTDIFCTHGGLSPNIKYIEQIPLLKRDIELPMSGPLCDLTWSDPEEGVEEWILNQRGAGYLFGQKQTNKFCQENKVQLICRAHQIAMKGYQYFFQEEQIVTVWSAPNYTYRSGNDASVLKIDKNKNRQFVVFQAVPDDKRVIPEELAESSYFA
ncbi:Serine/threonine protein phosphatase PP-V [Tritrichomonas foetus]|uniref:Serine/threonine-protein phosphatase n=1 Tax=Tritrichomonas foetus TaxID=1144522 RepID=A0A1J4KYZ6_9EUKA|nr:Serine/threonine protein phosphatase PP-V [Tritrichomonas foetus]|eukprot:OHT16378.1 Serine/threonine protein phosphatase PP-V [Tritrichomonas foetus]